MGRKIYHIVHVDRLPSIIADGCLWSDAAMAGRSGVGTGIGMERIKDRRRKKPVSCHRGTFVGDYVPFYFCPRSVMLFKIHRGGDPELPYQGGQGSIVHLEADMREAVSWAGEHGAKWAFSTMNASDARAEFHAHMEHFDKIDWKSVNIRYWGGSGHRGKKQSEFLVHEKIPWRLISRIGVKSREVLDRVRGSLSESNHRPQVDIMPGWYYDGPGSERR